ncbi:MAG TPA: caspase family protein [Halomicronema sp.]
MTRYALVIGIAQYQSPNLLALPKAVTDAEVFAQVLEDYGDYKVTRLPGRRNADKNRFEMVDKKVGGKELGEELKNLLLERGENSEVLIYYAGHGFTTSDNLGRQQGFLATSDSQLEISGETIVSQKNSISLESLNQLIQDSNLSSLVMLFDCCHSGFFLESQLVQKTLSAFTSQKDYYLITACRSFETARSFKGEAHTIFTGSLLKGLSPENTGIHRRVTGDRLFDFISGDLKNSAQQEPIRLGWGKSITLVTYPPTENNPEKLPESFAVDRSNPYVGLASFSLEENEYFFGRETAVRDLLEFLKNGRFLAVIGPSGCGKSSLIKAGLLPLLKKNGLPGSSEWPVAIFTPGTQPLENLARAFYPSNNSQNSILFIDQFEELFTLCDNEEQRKEFIHRITQEATNTERFTRVILSMRGDFLDRCAQYQEIADLVNKTQPTTYMVTKLTPAELEEAIEKPATKHGVDFEWGLVGEIIGDVVDQAGALPLLQYALAELWRVCVSNSKEAKPQLARECYKNIGGVGGALEKRADELYHNLEQSDKKLVQKLFLELVQLGEGKEVTRRRATWEDLEIIADSTEQLERVTRQLAGQQQRLIITDEDTVEVAHEALLTEWRLLVNWIEENRESLRLGRRLKSECVEWEKNQKSEDWLLADAWLAGIAKWVEKTQPRLSGIEQEFLAKSLEKRDREIQSKLDSAKREAEAEAERAKAAEAMALVQLEKSMEAQARAEAEAKAAEETAKFHKQRSKFTVAAGVFISLFLGLGIVAKQLQDKNQKSQLVAAGALVENAKFLHSQNPDQLELDAVVESVKALSELDRLQINDPKSISDLQNILNDDVREINRWQAHDDTIYSLAVNSAGTQLLTGSGDKKIKLWDSKGTLLAESPLQSALIYSVKFSPNGKTIASASEDGYVKLWKQENKQLKAQKTLPRRVNAKVYEVVFHPTNKDLIAYSSSDGFIRLYNIKNSQIQELDARKSLTTQELQKLDKEFNIYTLTFNSTGDTIAYPAWSGGGKVYLWSWQKSKVSEEIINNKSLISNILYKGNGKILFTGDNYGVIKLWDTTKNYQQIGEIKAHPQYITSLALHESTKTLASSSTDGYIKLWPLEQPETKHPLNQKNLGTPLETPYRKTLVTPLDTPYRKTLGTPLDTPFQKIHASNQQVTTVKFYLNNPNMIVSSDNENMLRIWNWNISQTTSFKETPKELLAKTCLALKDYLKTNPINDIQKICDLNIK